ncbi:MAG TPA: hypothetical protein PK306_08565 [Aquabacterium sp.]|nr:hypothetical protein [Aquabacterium sp.]HQC95746.1 hypothetical protein [Aquabacterium sp.]
MNVPFSVLKTAGGGKGAALLALLAGLVIVTAMKNAPASSASNATGRPGP